MASHGQNLETVGNKNSRGQNISVHCDAAALSAPLSSLRLPNALEKSAQHSYATQKGLTRFPSHKQEGPQNLSKLQ